MLLHWVAIGLTAGQGEAFTLSVPHEPGLVAVTVQWESDWRPLARDSLPAAPDRTGALAASAAGGAWSAWLGVDLDEAPGDRALPLRLRFDDGRMTESSLDLTIEPRSYPETRLTVENRFVELGPDDQQRAAEEAAEIARIYATTTPAPLTSGPFTIPVEGATGGRNFGHRRFFNDQPRAPHSGADLRAAEGTPILASNAGRVVLAKPLFFSGNAVFIDHGMGVYSVYLHLSEFRVAVGDHVESGQVLGLAGATGRVTGPHLHWGVRIHGARVDPFTVVASD